MNARPHEFIIMVAGGDRQRIEAERDGTIALLERSFETASFKFYIADEVVDGGRYLVVPFRGYLEDGRSLKPMPPDGIRQDAERLLEEIRFLAPPVLN